MKSDNPEKSILDIDFSGLIITSPLRFFLRINQRENTKPVNPTAFFIFTDI